LQGNLSDAQIFIVCHDRGVWVWGFVALDEKLVFSFKGWRILLFFVNLDEGRLKDLGLGQGLAGLIPWLQKLQVSD
jgi:hypothetical protein